MGDLHGSGSRLHLGGACHPAEVAEGLALNFASFGMRIVSVTGDETRGEIVTNDWPGPEALTFFGLT